MQDTKLPKKYNRNFHLIETSAVILNNQIKSIMIPGVRTNKIYNSDNNSKIKNRISTTITSKQSLFSHENMNWSSGKRKILIVSEKQKFF